MINAPHEVQDQRKYNSMIESLRTNATLPAVVGTGVTGLTGSHRIAAYNQAIELWESEAEGWSDSNKPELEFVEVSNEDYSAACELGEVAHHGEADLNDFCEWLYSVTDDAELKSALEDQRH